MKICVTGADGFIGSHVVEELVARGHEVTALAQYNSFNSIGWLSSLSSTVLGDVRIMSGDVRDPFFVNGAVRGHQRVAHLAALIAIPYSYIAPSSYIDVNIHGTLNVLQACRDHEIGRLIHTSTSEVYGSAQYVPIDERHPLVGQSPYSASKIGADQLAHSFWTSYGLPITTIRPFNTYGPRQSQRALIPSVIVQALAKSREVSLGFLEPTRDLTFVKDTARGFADSLESEAGVGETFNMGSGFEVSMADVVDMIFEIAGYRPKVVLDEQRVRPKASEVERLWSDSSKFERTFSWKPEHSGRDGLQLGLEKTYEWFTAQTYTSGYEPNAYVR